MKLVKEHIGFERGIDPKEAMGTGYSSTVKGLTDIYRDVVDRLKRLTDVKRMCEFGDEAYSYIPKRLKGECGWANLDKIFDKLTKEEFKNFRKLILKYKTIINNIPNIPEDEKIIK